MKFLLNFVQTFWTIIFFLFTILSTMFVASLSSAYILLLVGLPVPLAVLVGVMIGVCLFLTALIVADDYNFPKLMRFGKAIGLRIPF